MSEQKMHWQDLERTEISQSSFLEVWKFGRTKVMLQTDLSTHHRHLLVEERPLVAAIHDHQLLELSHYNRGKPVGDVARPSKSLRQRMVAASKAEVKKSPNLASFPQLHTELLDLAIVAEDREQPRTRVM